MSTLKVTNIQATGETASRAVSGVAAAWVNFNGTGTIAIRNSSNASSLVDEGTASYVVNYTSAMNDADYSVGGTLKYTGSGTGLSLTLRTSTPLTTTSVDVLANADNGVSATDNDTMLINVHGDLA